jgi:hypothetical protein
MTHSDPGPAAADTPLDDAISRLAAAVVRLDAATREPGHPPPPILGAGAPVSVSREELARRLDAAVARLKAILDE